MSASIIKVDVNQGHKHIRDVDKSVNRLSEKNDAAKNEPTWFNKVLCWLALFAAAGTLINASFEIADSMTEER